MRWYHWLGHRSKTDGKFGGLAGSRSYRQAFSHIGAHPHWDGGELSNFRSEICRSGAHSKSTSWGRSFSEDGRSRGTD